MQPFSFLENEAQFGGSSYETLKAICLRKEQS